MARILSAGVFGIVLVGALIFGILGGSSPACSTFVHIAEERFCVRVADSEVARVKGLSGPNPFEGTDGMLFLFPSEGRYGFWMKDMTMPIDIVWVDVNGSIVGVDHNVAPDSYPSVYMPPAPVDRVLELKAGVVRDEWEGEPLRFERVE